VKGAISLNRAETIAEMHKDWRGKGASGMKSRAPAGKRRRGKGQGRPQFGHRLEKESGQEEVPCGAPYQDRPITLISGFRAKASGKKVSEENSPGDDVISDMNSHDPEERRREEFLARAREAEARAAKTTDAMLRESWLKVAQGYHELARKK
jgi:hypothetical protein